jgi:catechol 2,3-dioxygenase-like lactoylglutathione lyase family enzyme
MTQRVTPMLHVPDVRATIDWYTSIGFTLVRLNDDDGEINWASLTRDGSELMLSLGGAPSAAHRREVDLYILTDDIDVARRTLPEPVDIVEDIHDTFYGMRELIVRDNNRFWVTFGQSLPRPVASIVA